MSRPRYSLSEARAKAGQLKIRITADHYETSRQGLGPRVHVLMAYGFVEIRTSKAVYSYNRLLETRARWEIQKRRALGFADPLTNADREFLKSLDVPRRSKLPLGSRRKK